MNASPSPNGNGHPLLDAGDIDASLDVMAEQIAAHFGDASQLCLIGIRRRGDVLAHRIRDRLRAALDVDVPVGSLDITLYRDDFDSLSRDPVINQSDIPFDLERRTVVLIDDVIFTGRTVRAALDEILDLGRPERVALVVLIDRGGRELPIAPDLTGRLLETAPGDEVHVLLNETDGTDAVFLHRAEE